jgi:undecaprenyl pyrophosphate synthase
MLDKLIAKKLNPLVNSPQWEAFKEHLNNLKNLELQALVVATSEQEMYRLQGKLSLLGKLEELDLQVKEAINRKEETQ